MRLHQSHFDIADQASRDLGITVLAPPIKVPVLGEMIHEPPADVVPRQRVFATRVAKSYDEFHDPLIAGAGAGSGVRKRAGELPAL